GQPAAQARRAGVPRGASRSDAGTVGAALLPRCVRLDGPRTRPLAGGGGQETLLHHRADRAVLCATLAEVLRRLRRVVPGGAACGRRGCVALAHGSARGGGGGSA